MYPRGAKYTGSLKGTSLGHELICGEKVPCRMPAVEIEMDSERLILPVDSTSTTCKITRDVQTTRPKTLSRKSIRIAAFKERGFLGSDPLRY